VNATNLESIHDMSEENTWEAWRAPNGRLYFHEIVSGTTTWNLPSDSMVEELARSDFLPVNDAEAWDCFQVTIQGLQRFYFVNRVSGEKTWRVPPGCTGKQPVNIAKSWLMFKDAKRNRHFYFNIMSREKTWHRPAVLCTMEEDPDPPLDEVVKAEEKSTAFIDDEGEEFFIPEDLQTSSAEEEEEEEEENMDDDEVDDAKMRARELERAEEERLEKLRTEYLEKQENLFRRDFEEMLEEYGIQPYSQWENWYEKLEPDPRFQQLDLERRAEVFSQYALSLINQDKPVRKRRILACLDTLESVVGASKNSGNAETLLTFLREKRDSTSSSADKKQVIKAINIFSGLAEKDRSRVVRTLTLVRKH